MSQPPHVSDLGPEPDSLPAYTDKVLRKTVVIDWYRTPIPAGELKSLHQRTDRRGWVQTGGYLAVLGAAFAATVYSCSHAPWWVTVGAFFLYGTVAGFLLNAVHELGHGTVFKTKGLNVFFVHVVAFLSWTNHEIFQSSHTRHHRYTLHPPDDLEVTLPIRVMVKHFFQQSFVDLGGFWHALRETWRIARGKFRGEWELTLYPESAPEKRWEAVRWAWALLLGHGVIIAGSILSGHWIVGALISGGGFVGKWLFFLCNNTQHIGLQDHVPDFRLCSRTFLLNPVTQFLYWHMNFHIEHHMYAAVPCYNLERLHHLIAYDLPPSPNGIYAVWKEIAMIQARQAADPTYRYEAPIPSRPGA